MSSAFASSQSRNFKTVNNVSNAFPNLQHISSDLVPSSDNVYTVGTTKSRWKTVYANQFNATGDNAGTSAFSQVSIINDLNVGGTTTTMDLDVNGSASFNQMAVGDFTPDARLIPTFEIDESTNLQLDNSQALSATSINATQYLTAPWVSAMGIAVTDKLKVTSAFNTASVTDTNSAFNIRDGGGNVGQDWRIGGNLYVVGSSNLTGALNMTGIISSSNTTNTSSASDTSSSLNTAGGGNVQKDWRVGQNLYVVGTTNLTGATTCTAPATFNSSNLASGVGTPAINIPNGGVRVGTGQGIQAARSLFTGDTEFIGGLYQTDGVGQTPFSLVSGSVTMQTLAVGSGGSTFNGNSAFNGNVTQSGTLRVNNSTASSSTTTGAVAVTGGVGVGGAIYVGGTTNLAGVTSVTASTVSSSTSTGALVVTGGVGIGGVMYTGGVYNQTNSTDISGTSLSAAGSIITAGGMAVGKQINCNKFYSANEARAGSLFLSTYNPGSTWLPSGTSSGLYMSGWDTTNPVVGRIWCGDGTGWSLKLPSRTGAADTDRFEFRDNGQFQTYTNRSSTSTSTGTIICAGGMGVAGDTNSAGYWKTSNANTAQNSNPAVHINSAGGFRQGIVTGSNSCTNVFQNSTEFINPVYMGNLNATSASRMTPSIYGQTSSGLTQGSNYNPLYIIGGVRYTRSVANPASDTLASTSLLISNAATTFGAIPLNPASWQVGEYMDVCLENGTGSVWTITTGDSNTEFLQLTGRTSQIFIPVSFHCWVRMVRTGTTAITIHVLNGTWDLGLMLKSGGSAGGTSRTLSLAASGGVGYTNLKPTINCYHSRTSAGQSATDTFDTTTNLINDIASQLPGGIWNINTSVTWIIWNNTGFQITFARGDTSQRFAASSTATPVTTYIMPDNRTSFWTAIRTGNTEIVFQVNPN